MSFWWTKPARSLPRTNAGFVFDSAFSHCHKPVLTQIDRLAEPIIANVEFNENLAVNCSDASITLKPLAVVRKVRVSIAEKVLKLPISVEFTSFEAVKRFFDNPDLPSRYPPISFADNLNVSYTGRAWTEVWRLPSQKCRFVTNLTISLGWRFQEYSQWYNIKGSCFISRNNASSISRRIIDLAYPFQNPSLDPHTSPCLASQLPLPPAKT